MHKPPLHYLRCLRALGYPLPHIAERSHPDVLRWEDTGHVPTPEATDALLAFYRSTGERVATPETTGATRNAISRVRHRARVNGWLPPYAYDEDDDGHHVGDGHRDALRNDIAGSGRPEDLVATTAFAIAKTVLANPVVQVEAVAADYGVTRVWDEIHDLGLNQMRDMDSTSVPTGRGWTDPARAKALYAAAAAVEIGADPLEEWTAFTGRPFRRRVGGTPRKVKTAA